MILLYISNIFSHKKTSLDAKLCVKQDGYFTLAASKESP